MDNNAIMRKLDEIENDHAFLEYLLQQDTPEKIQKVFSEKGIALSLDEVKKIVLETLSRLDNENTDEISESDLEDVSGGFAISAAICIACVVASCAGGFAIGWRAAKNKCM